MHSGTGAGTGTGTGAGTGAELQSHLLRCNGSKLSAHVCRNSRTVATGWMSSGGFSVGTVHICRLCTLVVDVQWGALSGRFLLL